MKPDRAVLLVALGGLSIAGLAFYQRRARLFEILVKSVPGYRRMRDKETTPALRLRAVEILKAHARKPIGTQVPFELEGKRYMAVIEQHYHPPGGPLKPWGPHPGVSLFIEIGSASTEV